MVTTLNDFNARFFGHLANHGLFHAFSRLDIEVAAEHHRLVADLGGDGGVIVVAPSGAAIYSFNTSGMYRGRATSEGVSEVAIFGED